MSALRQPGLTIQFGSLCVLLFLLPFSKAAIELSFVGLFIGWLWERVDPKTRRDTVWLRPDMRPVAAGILAWLGACALSIAVSGHRLQSLEGFINKWVEYLLFFVIVADLGARPKIARRAAFVVCCSAALVAFEALTQEIWGKGVLRGYLWIIYFRITGPYENPIDLATYFMVVIPLLLGFAGVQRGRRRAAVWALIAVLVACLGRTLAFGVWLSFLAALIAMSWRPGPLRKPMLTLLAAVVVAAAVCAVHERQYRIVTLSDVGTADRVFMWQAALRMIADRPLLGHGVNTFMSNYLDYWVGGERMPRYAHNCYLQVAAETGLIGLAAFVWLLAAAGRRLWRAISRAAGPDAPLLAGLAAGLLAFVLHAGYDTNFYSMRQAALFWTLAGLAAGVSVRTERPAG